MWLIVPAGWVTADDDVRVAFSGAMVLVGHLTNYWNEILSYIVEVSSSSSVE